MEDSMESEVITSSLTDAHASAGASSSSCSQYLTAENESIEDSKVHWSKLLEVDSDLTDDQIVADNTAVFRTLQSHPEWGKFFRTFNEKSGPSLVVAEKFAEGGQAELFNAHVTWNRSLQPLQPFLQQAEKDMKWAVKMFKKGSLLQQLQSQWPHGYLQWIAEVIEQVGIKRKPFVSTVAYGTLLPSGSFAFLMSKQDEDLRNLIVRNRANCGFGGGPFQKETFEKFMYEIACGMDWLHKRKVIHRDLKASNVLVTRNTCFVADFECSIGVIGTGYWRAPEILQACEERNASQRPELFIRASDVYSYAMTCYEILTGKLPFENEVVTSNLIIGGHRPEVPDYVDEWIHKLLCLCWQSNPEARPTFEEILDAIAANTVLSSLKGSHIWHRHCNNEEIKPLLGCNKLSHNLEMMECTPYESGVYMCKLCLKEGNGVVYHCSSCGDFDLHLECATIPLSMNSFMHPHDVILLPGGMPSHEGYNGQRIICNACQLEVFQETYYNGYICPSKECNFYVHIHCAKYARTISHDSHKEHELVLTNDSTMGGRGKCVLGCNSCSIQLNPLEFIYCCRVCRITIHPHCIIGQLECKSW